MSRAFIGGLIGSLLLPAMSLACEWQSRAGSLDLTRASATEVSAALSSGRVTSVQLVRGYLERIKKCDQQYHAIIAVNPEAKRIAGQLDAERASGLSRGPLHGVPVIIKDNIDVAGMVTTAGSLALAGNMRHRDAPLVASLRAAGVIVLAKSNLSEWANFRSRQSSSGWSAAGGLTVNARDVTRSACGSSSGSAVAVALRYAPLAVGTETNGSIVCPASVNGVVGLKPTVGKISQAGIVPISAQQDTAGPMAATVADAALLLAAMNPMAPKEADSVPVPADLKGVRLGVARFIKGFSPRTEAVFAKALDRLKANGAELVEVENFDLTELRDLQLPLLLTEFKPGVNAYLQDSPAAVRARTLDQLIAFHRNEPREMLHFGLDLFEQSQAARGLEEAAHQRSLVRVQANAQALEQLFNEHRIVALLAPTSGPAWSVDLVNGDRGVGSASLLPAITGRPHLTVPMGEVQGLPVGLSWMGPADSEQRLLSLALAYEAIRR